MTRNTSKRMTPRLSVGREEGSAGCNARKTRGLVSVIVAACFVFTTFMPLPAAARGLVLIRDAEIEALLRDYANPVFRAAGLVPNDVRVHLIGEDSINAFVANGQRVFMHTGLLMQAETPNEVIGVLAHEAAHISGGHLARLRRQIDRASTTAIIGMLLGAVAVAGGVVAGSAGTAQAGQSVMLGGSDFAMRNLLSYQRAQEAAADQAAVNYLDQSGQSASGMLRLFEKLANQSLVSLQYADPYVLSHPMPRDRISFLDRLARQSPFFDKADSDELVYRHSMMQAKLHGYLYEPRDTLRRYPTSDASMQGRYARAIAFFRSGELDNSLQNIDSLLAAEPSNPYFWEVKGQALFETGNVARSIEPLSRAAELAPNAAQIRILLAQAMLGTENEGYVDTAIEHLRTAYRIDGGSVGLHRQLAIAYGRKGNIGMAELESAEAAVQAGDLDLAKTFAERARGKLERGTPQYVRAQDILRLNPTGEN